MSLLQQNPLLVDAWKCYRAAIDAVDPQKSLTKTFENPPAELQSCDGGITVIALGKASIPMAQAFLNTATQSISRCLVIHPSSLEWKNAPSFVELIEGEHPFPGEGSIKAGKRLLETAKKLSADDTLILLISGGASSLACAPFEGISFEDKLPTIRSLLKVGTDIKGLNCVRKHLSAIKGGRLIQRTACRKIIAFIVSDVIGNDISVIASGLSAPDASTYREAYDICAKAGAPQKVLAFLEKGMQGEYPETPKPNDPIFKKVKNVVIAFNKSALEKAVLTASSLGYKSAVLTDSLAGEAKTIGKKLAWLLKAMKPGSFVAAGGETVVKVKGKGKGGRCQELVLSAAIELDKTDNVLLWASGSDGIDGITDAAGAWVDGSTIEKARNLSLDPDAYLAENNSYFFFDKVQGLIKTGPTGTNVMDLIFLLKKHA